MYSTKDNAIKAKFAAALRPLTPDGASLTDGAVLDRWRPSALLFSADEYGDAHCTCGHPIKHVFEVALVESPDVTFSPVGSSCVERFYDDPDGHFAEVASIEDDFRRILFTLEEAREGTSYCLTEELVCAKNGFSKGVMRVLDRYIDARMVSYLRELRDRRQQRRQTPAQQRFLHVIGFTLVRFIKALSGRKVRV